MSEPSEFLRMVVSGRKDFEEAKAKEDRHFEVVKALPEYQAYEAARGQRLSIGKDLKAAEKGLRGIAEFILATGEPKPGFVQRVREVVGYSYSVERAVEWAEKNMPIAVVKTVKASLVESAWKESGLPDFAQETVSRTVYLRSGDLSEFLEDVDAEED